MKLKDIKKILGELDEKYLGKFAYIEKVIKSCISESQLLSAIQWGRNCIDMYENFECRGKSESKREVISEYFTVESRVVWDIYANRYLKIIKK